MKKVKKPKTIPSYTKENSEVEPKKEIIFRLKRPNETPAYDILCKKNVYFLRKLIKI